MQQFWNPPPNSGSNSSLMVTRAEAVGALVLAVGWGLAQFAVPTALRPYCVLLCAFSAFISAMVAAELTRFSPLRPPDRRTQMWTWTAGSAIYGALVLVTAAGQLGAARALWMVFVTYAIVAIAVRVGTLSRTVSEAD